MCFIDKQDLKSVHDGRREGKKFPKIWARCFWTAPREKGLVDDGGQNGVSTVVVGHDLGLYIVKRFDAQNVHSILISVKIVYKLFFYFGYDYLKHTYLWKVT